MPTKKKAVVGRRRQHARRRLPPDSPGPLTPKDLARRMAENATLWIYREVGRHKGKVPPPGWVPPDAMGEELQRLLLEKFLPEAEQRLRVERDPRFKAIEDACMAWARKKYGETSNATIFGKRLVGIAISVLFSSGAFGVIPTVRAAHEILKEREQAPPPRERLDGLTATLDRFGISKKKQQAILAEARNPEDPVRDLLREFFFVKQGRWRRILDRQGRVRRKKLPTLAEARERLLEAFRHPEGPHLSGLPLSANDAYELMAECLRAAFPQQARATTPESVKQALAYHRQMKRRPPSTRGQYGRV